MSPTALTVLTGVAFGLIEMRRARREREERAAFAAVQALMSPEWMSSSMIVASIPEGTTAAELENNPRVLEAALKIATIMEGIGYSVFARIVPLSVADDLVGGMARIAWRKFRPFVLEERERTGHAKKLGMVPMAGGTARPSWGQPDQSADRRLHCASQLETISPLARMRFPANHRPSAWGNLARWKAPAVDFFLVFSGGDPHSGALFFLRNHATPDLNHLPTKTHV